MKIDFPINPDKLGVTPTVVADMARDVIAFHEKFKINYVGPYRQLPPDLHEFRLRRLCEEVVEYDDAKELHDCLDALLDLIYIALGTAHVHGFGPTVIYAAWDAIHQANMRKELASSKNPSKHGHPTDIVKPRGWVAPNIEGLLK